MTESDYYVYVDDTWMDDGGWEYETYNCISHAMNGSAVSLEDAAIQIYMHINGLYYYEELGDELSNQLENMKLNELLNLIESADVSHNLEELIYERYNNY